MNKIMYAASLSWGEVSLIKLTLAKETKHTISVADKEVIIDGGYQWFGVKRVHKNRLNLFDTELEAIEYLIETLEESNRQLQLKMAKNNTYLKELEELKND